MRFLVSLDGKKERRPRGLLSGNLVCARHHKKTLVIKGALVERDNGCNLIIRVHSMAVQSGHQVHYGMEFEFLNHAPDVLPIVSLFNRC